MPTNAGRAASAAVRTGPALSPRRSSTTGSRSRTKGSQLLPPAVTTAVNACVARGWGHSNQLARAAGVGLGFRLGGRAGTCQRAGPSEARTAAHAVGWAGSRAPAPTPRGAPRQLPTSRPASRATGLAMSSMASFSLAAMPADSMAAGPEDFTRPATWAALGARSAAVAPAVSAWNRAVTCSTLAICRARAQQAGSAGVCGLDCAARPRARCCAHTCACWHACGAPSTAQQQRRHTAARQGQQGEQQAAEPNWRRAAKPGPLAPPTFACCVRTGWVCLQGGAWRGVAWRGLSSSAGEGGWSRQAGEAASSSRAPQRSAGHVAVRHAEGVCRCRR